MVSPAHLFELIEHNDVALRAELGRWIHQVIERLGASGPCLPGLLKGLQKSFAGSRGYGLPVVVLHALAGKDVRHARPQQRGLASARGAHQDDHRDLLVLDVPQQLSQFAFPAQLPEQLAVGGREGAGALDRGGAIVGGRKLGNIDQAHDSIDGVRQHSDPEGKEQSLHDQHDGPGIEEDLQLRRQPARKRKSYPEQNGGEGEQGLFATTILGEPDRRPHRLLELFSNPLPSRHSCAPRRAAQLLVRL